MGDPDRAGALLLHLSVVRHQRRLRVADPDHRVPARPVPQVIGRPRGGVQELLHPVRRRMPRPRRQRPPVHPAQPRQQAVDQVREHLPRLGPREQIPQPLRQRRQFLSPHPEVLFRHIHQHDHSTTAPITRHKICCCSTRPCSPVVSPRCPGERPARHEVVPRVRSSSCRSRANRAVRSVAERPNRVTPAARQRSGVRHKEPELPTQIHRIRRARGFTVLPNAADGRCRGRPPRKGRRENTLLPRPSGHTRRPHAARGR